MPAQATHNAKMPAPKNKEIDEALNMVGWTPEAIAAREAVIQKGSVGARSTKAATARTVIKKVAVPLELGLSAVEAARIASSPEVRESRVAEAEDLAKQSVPRRLFAAYDNPVGLIYGAGALAKEAEDTRSDPRIREQDLAYLEWKADRDMAAARKAQVAGSQQRSRALMLAQPRGARPPTAAAPQSAASRFARPEPLAAAGLQKARTGNPQR
jgi:hypothetical protein